MLVRTAGIYNQTSLYPLCMIVFAFDPFLRAGDGSGNEDIERQWL